jgi:hypothetical protein
MAWQLISPEVTVKGAECSIFKAFNGTDDVLWNDSEEDGNGSSKCEEVEGIDCEDGQCTNSEGVESNTNGQR